MVQRRGKRQWRVQYSQDGDMRSATFSRRDDAIAFEEKVRRERQLTRHGLEAPDENLLFFDYAAYWLTKRKKQIQYSTFVQDESRLRNYWIPKLGTRPLVAITSKEIREALDYIQFDLNHSPADRNRHRALLHKLFTDAFREEKIIVNPVARIPLVTEKVKRPHNVFHDPKEQEIYIRAAFKEGQSYGVLATLLIWGGPRISEAISIKWKDVHFAEDYILIGRTYEKASKKIIEKTKGQGEGGHYLIPLVHRLKSTLFQHQESTRFNGPEDFVCHTFDGNFIPYDTYKDVHRRILDGTGITRVTIHGLRHTFASNAEKSGVSKATIQRILGHADARTTERYTHRHISEMVESIRRAGFGEQSVEQIDSPRGHHAKKLEQDLEDGK